MKNCWWALSFCEFICVSTSLSQQDTLSDVFPLATGNEWKYHIYSLQGDPNDYTYTDSGTAVVRVTSKISTPDSVRWVFHEVRRYAHCKEVFGQFQDSCAPAIDSVDFEIIERLAGLHRLYRNAVEMDVWESVFPWSSVLTDTTPIYRYQLTDSVGLSRIGTHTARANYDFDYILSFRRGEGQVDVDVRASKFVIGPVYVSHQYLLSHVITSLSSDHTNRRSIHITLDQNYPNPFNPTTTIRYALPQPSHVTLTVFNMLCQEVANLVDENQEAGYHEVRFDASGLASGVYFYRLRAGEFVQSRTLVLVK